MRRVSFSPIETRMRGKLYSGDQELPGEIPPWSLDLKSVDWAQQTLQFYFHPEILILG
jgi:hypothetical protein